MLNAFYHTQDTQMSQPMRIPVGFELILKTVLFCVIKTKKEKRKSAVTKNELMRNMIAQAIHNQLKFKYILADSWFGSADNMRFIQTIVRGEKDEKKAKMIKLKVTTPTIKIFAQ